MRLSLTGYSLEVTRFFVDLANEIGAKLGLVAHQQIRARTAEHQGIDGHDD